MITDWRAWRALAVALGLAGCAVPAADRYVAAGGGGRTNAPTARVPVGANASGDACTQQPGSAGDAYVYCGSWDQPSGHITPFSGTGSLADIATSSPWRTSLDVRFVCSGQEPATFAGGAPAILIRCSRKIGGWPQTAFVTREGDRTYVGDGVTPAMPAIERGAGVLAGRLEPGPAVAAPSGDPALEARRLAARASGSGDIGQYEGLMAAGARANQTGDYAAAEQAYRAAVGVQQKGLGATNPNIATPMMHQALQVSDQGRFIEAASLFAAAEPLTRSPQLSDRTAAPRLAHYRALDLLNQDKPADALALLKTAEAQYLALVPADMLRARPAATGGASRLADQLGDEDFRADPIARNALIGVIEARRNEAVALRMLGRDADSEQAAQAASELATRTRNIARTAIPARLFRTAAFAAGRTGGGASVSLLSQSSSAFSRALPLSKPVAETELLLAAQLAERGRDGDARDSCANAATILRSLRTGIQSALMEPCLGVFARIAMAQLGSARQASLTDMFEAAQLAQGSVTGQQIAQASALLAENARDPKVAEAIRRRDATARALEALSAERDALAGNGEKATRADTGDLDRRLAEARTAQADADAALQTASPNYGQLVQQVVPAKDVLAALRPHEAFAAIVFGRQSGWTFLLTDGRIDVARVDGGPARVDALVKRVRASMESETAGPPPPFDTDASATLFASVFGGVRADLDGLSSITVAPTGSLLSVPFGLLLTGPATPGSLATSPWLVRQMAVAHVPAAANFVTLRKVAGTSRASRPWFGFGEFKPVTLAQAQRSFPLAACADSARLLAGLPPLPGARVELEAARKLLDASPSDELLGPAFTVPNVMQARLADFRVLHFATHALLPTELRCQNEPAIATSAPVGAADAKGALLTASQVSRLELDADAVILSACNTGGPAGGAAGESLSGLARSFFFAGARSLFITHWSVNDQFTAYLVALTLNAARTNGADGLAAALRTAQLRILDEAKGDTAQQAHPFFWAPLALIGDGSGGSGRKLAQR